MSDHHPSHAEAEAVEYPPPPPADRWAPDVLGTGFEARTLPLGHDDEGDVAATLVRFVPRPDPLSLLPGRNHRYTVLYLHGWSDYFFQTELAVFWEEQGADFFALDLRKFGRSLRGHQTPGYIEDIETYDDDLEAALAVIAAERAVSDRVVLMGHSMGGLVASLWAHRHPGRLAGLVLNSPWLDIPGSTFLRAVSTPVVEQLARMNPKNPLPRMDPGFYGRSVSADQWGVDERWRPSHSMPLRPGWILAMLKGHARVAEGLSIGVPILVLTAQRSHLSAVWSAEMRTSDVVLDVDVLARRSLELGPVVTVARIKDAVHDVVLSEREPRERAYAEMHRWARGYLTT